MIGKDIIEELLKIKHQPPISKMDEILNAVKEIKAKPPISRIDEILNSVGNLKMDNNNFNSLESSQKNQKKSSKNTKNKMNSKNCCKLADMVEIQKSQIETLSLESKKLREELASSGLNAKQYKSNKWTEHYSTITSKFAERVFTYFSEDVHWKSFAFGILTLAGIIAYIYFKFA